MAHGKQTELVRLVPYQSRIIVYTAIVTFRTNNKNIKIFTCISRILETTGGKVKQTNSYSLQLNSTRNAQFLQASLESVTRGAALMC
jgi:hypothetical protein